MAAVLQSHNQVSKALHESAFMSVSLSVWPYFSFPSSYTCRSQWPRSTDRVHLFHEACW